MYPVCHKYILILLFQMLATIFGLTTPSSGQIFIKELYYINHNFIVFINIWPDDGLVRQKLVAII